MIRTKPTMRRRIDSEINSYDATSISIPAIYNSQFGGAIEVILPLL
jgi:hypothetical protein